MGFSLDQVVPWGRSYDEYVAMFGLDDAALRARILGCGDGPAAFNAGVSARGGSAVACDPLYAYSPARIRQRIEQTRATVIDELRRNAADYRWDEIGSVDDLARLRLAAMQAFLLDFASGARAGRYVAGELPRLPFAGASFDLALCSHLLFLYGVQLSQDFHLHALEEMLRVAREVRVFPLLTLDGWPSPYLPAVHAHFSARGCAVALQRVAYEFQRGGHTMLRIARKVQS